MASFYVNFGVNFPDYRLHFVEAYDGFKHVPLVSSIIQNEYYFDNQFIDK